MYFKKYRIENFDSFSYRFSWKALYIVFELRIPDILSIQDTSYIVPSTFQCVLDMDAGTLGFIADGQWLGTAFSG